MIHLADAALVSWLSTLACSVDVVVGSASDADTGPSSRRASRSTVNLELVAVREQTSRRDHEVHDVRDASGRVVERQRSTRWFELDYRCSAAGASLDAHRVLGAVVQLLVDHDAVPAEHVPAELAAPLAVHFVPDEGTGVAAGIVLRVVVPVRPTPERTVAPPTVVLHLDVAQEPAPEPEGDPTPSDAPASTERAWTTIRRRELIGSTRVDAFRAARTLDS